MTREEEIKEAYKDYTKYGVQSNPWLAFKNGAEWADKQPFVAWHKATEEPTDKDAELIIDSDVGIKHYTFNYMLYKFGSAETWQTICLHMGINQWCYVDEKHDLT